jgi:hypothetical protein
MSLTERNLRDLLAERAAPVTAAPGQVEAVQARARRQRRRNTAVTAFGLVAVVALGLPAARHLGDGVSAPSVTPLQSVTPTPSPSKPAPPSTSYVATVDGLRIGTSGPSIVKGAGVAPFTVTVTLTNTTPTAWTGTVGVGLYGLRVDYYFGDPANEPLLYPAGFPVRSSTDPAWFHFATAGGRVEGLADLTPRTITPGETITIAIGMVKQSYGFPHTEIRGWIPVLNPAQPLVKPAYPNAAQYPVITFY